MIHSQARQSSLILAPVTSATNASTKTSSNIDADRADYVTISISLAAEVNTNAVGPTLSVQHADTTDATNFATITANRTAEDITSAKLVKYDIDRRGRKRYLRLVVTNGDTTTNDLVTVAATADLSRLREGPAAATGMVSGNAAAVVVSS